MGSSFIIGANNLVSIVNFPTSLIVLNDVLRWVRPIVGKIVHRLHYLVFSIQNLHVNAEIME